MSGGLFKGGGGGIATELASQLGRAARNAFAKKRIRAEAERERERQDAQLASPPSIHGSAKWATPDEARLAGLLRADNSFENGRSIFLGAMTDEGDVPQGFLHWDDEGHLMTVAPTRTGKSTTLIIPNLLRYRGSAVVLDPKGELYEATSKWRSENVGPVYRLNPYQGKTHAFNPLATIVQASDARALAEIIIPPDPNSADFFRKDAVAFLTALLLYVTYKAPSELRNMSEVRRMSSAPLEAFGNILEAMMLSDVPAIRNSANIIQTKPKDRGLSTLRETLHTDLAIFDLPGVVAATERSDFDFKDLKDKAATVYITVPFSQMDALGPFVKIALTCALNAMIQNERQPDIPVLFMMDEFLSLKSFEKFQDAMLTHAGAGVRLWFFLQNLAKLEQYYPTSWRSFFDAQVKIFFGTNDHFTGKLISEFLGDRTMAVRSSSLSASLSRNVGSYRTAQDPTEGITLNTSVNFSGRALMDQTEVQRFLKSTLPDQTRNSIITVSTVDPLKGRLIPYFLGTRASSRIGALKP